MAHAVDQLFAQWAGPDSPGASIAIIQDGKIVYSQGYGSANLEYGVPNTPATVFDLASASKQFTAFAIHLLAQDGKLSLDDDVRKYLPKLHDFGKVITIRQLLHHTSGVRDQSNLLLLAGWRLEDVITDEDVARLLFQQTELNFAPGDRFLYSNSGYTLLAMVVKHVSGKTLPEFAKERIFDPLGMAHTHFQDHYGIVVKDRAYSYAPQPDGKYQYVALSDSTVGPSGLFSTVGDLARWDENFYTGEVGGPGQFYSAELGVTYDVFVRDGALKLHYPRGDIDLDPIRNDAFAGAFPIGSLKFVCGADGECNAFSIDDGRVQNLRFVRVAITPVGPKSAG
jgi:CubicO group peptidase (beta-lactamase class C family)